MKKTLAALFLATVLLSFSSCKKDKGDDNNNHPRSAREFMAKHGPQLQTVSFNTSELPKTIVLRGGTRITIPQNAFTRSGSPVTGTITFNALEFYKRSDLLFGGSNTNHISGAPLETQGSFFLEATQNGVALDRQLAQPLTISVPAENNGDLTAIWEGQIAGVGGAQQLGWAPARMPNGAVEVRAFNEAFTFNFGQLGWVNCDVFYSNASPKTTVTVDVNNNPGALASFRGYTGETFVFYCPNDANVTAQLYTPDGPNRVKSYDNMMPIGSQGKLLVFSIKDGNYYLASKDITITADLHESVTLTESSEAAIQSAIEALDNY